jgi:prepilin-type N-terminal cleavage/methylation domain-containing protein
MRIMFDPPRGFSLIELLVVITIIVVLLALLTPALDRAIFQAELAVCGGNLKVTAHGAFNYASVFKRRYPYRAGVHDPNRGFKPNLLQLGTTYNDRPLLAPYIALNKGLNCAAAGEADLEGADPDTNGEAGYAMWFGWKYTQAGGGSGLDKLGDRLSWQQEQLSVIVSDYEFNGGAQQPFTYGSHPDGAGVLVNATWENLRLGSTANLGLIGGAKYTLSRWHGAPFRGPMEMNYAYTDGSVRRVNGVTMDAGAAEPRDPRMRHLPAFSHENVSAGDLAFRTPVPPG